MKSQSLAFDVQPTSLVAARGDRRRRIDLVVRNDGPEARGRIWAEWRGDRIVEDAVFPCGTSRRPFRIPLFEERRPMMFGIDAGKRTCRRRLRIEPPAAWSIRLVQHTHTDIGYTDYQEEVLREHLDFLDEAVALCESTREDPDPARFRWTCEVSWQIEHYRRHRDEAAFLRLIDCIRRGEIAVSALYLQLPRLYGREEILRQLYPALRLRREFGIRVDTAMNSDVNGLSWALVPLLSRCGVRYVNMAVNWTRGFCPFRERVGRPFWWKGPDGSRLFALNNFHYHFGHEIGVDGHMSPEEAESRIAVLLREQEAAGNPSGLLSIQLSGHRADNSPPSAEMCRFVREWNDRWTWPRIRTSTVTESLRDFEERIGDDAPVERGDWSDWWADGNASAAYETALSRRTQADLHAAEFWGAWLRAAGRPDPGSEWAQAAWRANMFFDEHTWGAADSIEDPWGFRARSQWNWKAGYAYRAADRAARARTVRAAAAVPCRTSTKTEERGLMISNPCDWDRREIVRTVLPVERFPLDRVFRIVDPQTDRPIPQLWERREHDWSVTFMARAPGLGYRWYPVREGDPPEPPSFPPSREGTLSNGRIHVAFRGDGALERLALEGDDDNWIDPDARPPAACLVHEVPAGRAGRHATAGPGGRYRRTALLPRQEHDGPLRFPCAERVGTGKGGMLESFERRIRIPWGASHLEMEWSILAKASTSPWALYASFPFGISSPRARVEDAAAWYEAGREQLRDSAHDYCAVQDWVDLSGEGRGVVVAFREACLVQLGEIRTGRYQGTLNLDRAAVFPWLMNNYWYTNFPAAQPGRTTFSFAVLPYRGRFSPLRATRFGWAWRRPLECRITDGVPDSVEDRLLEIEGGGALVSACKPADDGRGWIVRLYNPMLREIAADVRLASAAAAWWRCSPVEEDGERLAAKAAAVRVSLPPRTIETVRIEPA